MLCRVCNEDDETLGHVWTCKKTRSEMSNESKLWIENWTEGGSEEEILERLQEMLKGKISEELCRYIEKFERLCKKREKTEESEVTTEVNFF